MTIINYEEMIHNANLVKTLANKTIECSKDYVGARKDDIIDQMMEYLAETVHDVLVSGIDLDTSFCERANKGDGLSFGRFGGNGTGARLQFFFNYGNTYLRVYFNEDGYWYATKEISNSGLKYLIDHWDKYKQSWNDAIQYGIVRMNSSKASELEKQLALHEAVKNFQI